MPAWITPLISFIGEWAPAVLNSNFVTALAGAGLGAFAGAYIAQRIAEHAKSRDEIVREIRNTNAAIRLAATICNVCIALKKQHIKGLKETYDKKRDELIAVTEASILSPAIFEFVADFQSISPISIPAETYQTLQTVIFEKITGTSKTTNLVPLLLQAIHLFNDAVNLRNNLIDEIRAKPRNGEMLASFYFGLKDNHGNVDIRFGNAIEAMSSYIDDCIFFSKAIADDLAAQGTKRRDDFTKKARTPLPNIVGLSISETHREFLPDLKHYSDWDKVG